MIMISESSLYGMGKHLEPLLLFFQSRRRLGSINSYGCTMGTMELEARNIMTALGVVHLPL